MAASVRRRRPEAQRRCRRLAERGERRRRQAGERCAELEGVDRAHGPVENRQDSDGRSRATGDRNEQERLGDVARALGDVAGETRVARRFVDCQYLTGSGDIAGQATADRQLGADDRLGSSARGGDVTQVVVVRVGHRHGDGTEREAGGRAQVGELVEPRCVVEHGRGVEGHLGELVDQVGTAHVGDHGPPPNVWCRPWITTC